MSASRLVNCNYNAHLSEKYGRLRCLNIILVLRRVARGFAVPFPTISLPTCRAPCSKIATFSPMLHPAYGTISQAEALLRVSKHCNNLSRVHNYARFFQIGHEQMDILSSCYKAQHSQSHLLKQYLSVPHHITLHIKLDLAAARQWVLGLRLRQAS